MRYLMAVCLLAGCYKPSTDSCYYACATQGTPCPSGLTCVAGMCAAPGDTCSAAGDGGIDSSSDAAGILCGDGIPAVGEICFDTPTTFNHAASPRFGQLGDRDGDGDLDLIYGDPAGYRFHINNAGTLTSASVAGPAVADTPALVLANLTPSLNVELINITPGGIQGFAAAGTAAFDPLFNYPSAQFPQGTAMAFGQITSSQVGALAVIHGGTQLVLYELVTPTQLSEKGVYPVNGARRVTVGKLNVDAFEDVIVATDTGVVVFLGSPGGLGNPTPVGPSVRIENIVAGDLNGDDQGDIVFTTVSATSGIGTIQFLPGRGNGTFNPAASLQVTTLGIALAIADVDRDGRDDAIAFQGGASPAVLIFRLKPDGSLDTPIMLPVTTGAASHLSARGDLNDDKVPDIVLTDTSGRRVLVIPSKP